MGLFSSKTKFTDRISQNADLKDQDLILTIREILATSEIPLCIFHFADSGTRFRQLFERNDLRVHSLSRLSDLDVATPAGWRSRTDLLLLGSNNISNSDLKHSRRWQSGPAYRLLLLERFPIPAPDDLILSLATKRKDISAPTAFLALDNPWLRSIFGKRVENLLQQMGLDPKAVIQHSFISRSIRQAQERMKAKVGNATPQNSLESWLAENNGL